MVDHVLMAADSQETRRDFLTLTAAAVGAAGVAAVAWPFVSSLNPAGDVLALSSIEVDVSAVKVGQAITVKWRGQPVFIRRRTAEEIAVARKDDPVIAADGTVAENPAALRDPQPDAARVQRDEWLVLIGICTHLGCVPLGQKSTEPRGGYGGWYCPCHGSEYDTSGRIRKGPAPRDLDLPPYAFTSDTTIRIG